MSLERDLRLYELICVGSNINFMIDLNSNGLDEKNLNAALEYCKIKHPYLRMKIVPNENNSFKFVEMNDEERKFVPISTFKFSNVDEFSNWQERLIQVGNAPRDSTKSVLYLDLYSLDELNRHQIYGSINHSGIDGPGMFSVIKDLIHFLDAVLSKSEVKVESRKFEDIHKKYHKEYDPEVLKNEPLITDYLPTLKSIPEEGESCRPIISGEFYQFDENTTKKLVENCRHHKATVQGAISIASLIALLDTHQQDVTNEVNAVLSVPCNMRGLLEPKLTNDDCVCGSAALIWQQIVKANDNIWSLAATATENLHKLRDSYYGMKWWFQLANMLPMQQYSQMTSSVGVFDLNQSAFKNITINDTRMIGGAYSLPKEAVNNMTHAITILNRFTVVMSYTYPSLSKKWAKRFVHVQSEVLRYYANYDVKNDKPKALQEILHSFN